MLHETGQTFDTLFCERVSKECIRKYTSLSKTGKPTEGEWTVMSCIVQAEWKHQDWDVKVVSLGTGSKCIGESKLPKNGDRLHDSHAEVIVRRAFKLYLLEQLGNCLSKKDSIFLATSNDGFLLKNGVSFHLYSSNVPCGDASIFPKMLSESDSIGSSVVHSMRESDPNRGKIPPFKRMKISECDSDLRINDIHRTGAKCVSQEPVDPKEAGLKYHVTGVLRTKPGRGNPTLSHCCSDKMFKWTVLGIQGGILMIFLNRPIYLKTIIIGFGPFCHEAVTRALVSRFEESAKTLKVIAPFEIQVPLIMQARTAFPHSKFSLLQTSEANTSIASCGNPSLASEDSVSKESLTRFIASSPDFTKGRILKESDSQTVKSGSPSMQNSDLVKDNLQIPFPEHLLLSSQLDTSNCPSKICPDSLVSDWKNISSLRSSVSQSSSPKTASLRACSASIVWSLTSTHKNKTEVSVEGKRLGTSKKNENSPKSRVSVCRIELLRKVNELNEAIIRKSDEVGATLSTREQLLNKVSSLTYGQCKDSSVSYKNMRDLLKASVLSRWTNKPQNIKDFVID